MNITEEDDEEDEHDFPTEYETGGISYIDKADQNHEDIIQRGKEVSYNFMSEIQKALEVDDDSVVLPEHVDIIDADVGIFYCERCAKNFRFEQFRKHFTCKPKRERRKKEKVLKEFLCGACDRVF